MKRTSADVVVLLELRACQIRFDAIFFHHVTHSKKKECSALLTSLPGLPLVQGESQPLRGLHQTQETNPGRTAIRTRAHRIIL